MDSLGGRIPAPARVHDLLSALLTLAQGQGEDGGGERQGDPASLLVYGKVSRGAPGLHTAEQGRLSQAGGRWRVCPAGVAAGGGEHP